MQRYREVHDLVHAILGMPTNMLGTVFYHYQYNLMICVCVCTCVSVKGRGKQKERERERERERLAEQILLDIQRV